MFALPNLPYAYDALEPVMSDRTLHFHHDKHHATYVKTLNELLQKVGMAPASLEAVILQSAQSGDRTLFNNAAQSWNHAFFWAAMSPAGGQPTGDLGAAIDGSFGSLENLEAAFVSEGAGHFGSGWVWLVAGADGKLKVLSTHDANDAVTQKDLTPLIVCDLWEHAYYLDHQNDRKGFLQAWFKALPNWTLASSQLAAARGQGAAWRHPPPSSQAAAA